MSDSGDITSDLNKSESTSQNETTSTTGCHSGIPWSQICSNMETGISQLYATKLPPSQLSPEDVKVVIGAYKSRTPSDHYKHSDPLGAIAAEFTGSSNLLEIQGEYGGR